MKDKTIRSKAPLRIGLAGGGTDVSPYSDVYGGAILNATISMFAYATLHPTNDKKIKLISEDSGITIEYPSSKKLPMNGKLDLIKGIYNRIIKDYVKRPLSFELTTYVDAPPGSGLGTSSTLVTTVIGAFVEWLGLPLGEYDIAHLAYEIERIDLGMAGGKQDQYAATFGGFNYIEFFSNDKVIVNPLRIKQEYLKEMEFNFVLYYTGTSRLSSKIIEAQSKNLSENMKKSLEAMHKLKEQATLMKEAVLKGNISSIGKIMDFGWKYKKDTAKEVSNPIIDEIYNAALAAGSTGGKLSGAGGGGFFMFFCPGNSRYRVIEALQKFGGEFRRFNFTEYGLMSWQV